MILGEEINKNDPAGKLTSLLNKRSKIVGYKETHARVLERRIGSGGKEGFVIRKHIVCKNVF
jgi:hypothetical protein